MPLGLKDQDFMFSNGIKSPCASISMVVTLKIKVNWRLIGHRTRPYTKEGMDKTEDDFPTLDHI